MRFPIIVCLLALLPFPTPEGEAVAQNTAAPCETEQHRQFDFWVGDWTVTQNGQPAGVNRIEKVNGDCVIAERWTSATAGFSGRSLNIYDRAAGAWHQTWVDSSGLLLQLDGGLENGRMVLSGMTRGPDGQALENRITWTPNPDGSVQQLWETRPPDGDWSIAFDGHYVRSEDSSP